MSVDKRMQNPGNPYDPDDPDNYLNRDQIPGSSNIIPWMLGGMFAVATIIGLFFAEESPLTHRPQSTLTTENVSPQQSPNEFQSN